MLRRKLFKCVFNFVYKNTSIHISLTQVMDSGMNTHTYMYTCTYMISSKLKSDFHFQLHVQMHTMVPILEKQQAAKRKAEEMADLNGYK